MPEQWKDLVEEQKSFEDEVIRIDEWWKTPRQAGIKRPWTASTIASLRNTVPVPCLANASALKLWALLHEHRSRGTTELTFGATDPIAVSQMAKYMRTVYVSGGLSGFSENNYPGMDHADYPWDTVPKVVEKIFKSQQWHDQRQRQVRMQHRIEQRARMENWDYLMPIIADGDMGFGSLTATLKSTKALVESGAAGIHIDDLALGLKKFTIGQGRTIVPTSEYEDRVKAVRMQLDIMGAETLLFARCDLDHADFITSVIDPRDHEYILGATRNVKPLQEVIDEAITSGESPTAARDEWLVSAGTMTFDEAVEEEILGFKQQPKSIINIQSNDDLLNNYKSRVGYGTSLSQRRAIAKELLGVNIFFDWEIPRSHNGQYLYRSTVKAIIERATVVAPLGDVSWARMDLPDYNDIKAYHETMLSRFPSRLFAFSWGGEWKFPSSAGWTAERLKTVSQDMAKDYGVVWQIQPMYMIQGVNMEIEKSAEMWVNEGMGGYYEKIQLPATQRKPWKVDGYEKMSWCGGYLSDAFFAAIAGEEILQKK
ncbi:isocitrate lyase [Talaromyces proteolyticus]|uniref:Isocitrate lyase n=1 Tax=Talaromyces proteolyticus TaxID=1131652 RepID=A0AAD4PY76_9EURO|nr:isocitrate lyase [Talaromyces proteolyticus]KAH8697454.1 isocitrate lyase [Talaromyces proteolyticus]